MEKDGKKVEKPRENLGETVFETCGKGGKDEICEKGWEDYGKTQEDLEETVGNRRKDDGKMWEN